MEKLTGKECFLPAIVLTAFSIVCGTNFEAFKAMTAVSVFASIACIGIGLIAFICWIKIFKSVFHKWGH